MSDCFTKFRFKIISSPKVCFQSKIWRSFDWCHLELSIRSVSNLFAGVKIIERRFDCNVPIDLHVRNEINTFSIRISFRNVSLWIVTSAKFTVIIISPPMLYQYQESNDEHYQIIIALFALIQVTTHT